MVNLFFDNQPSFKREIHFIIWQVILYTIQLVVAIYVSCINFLDCVVWIYSEQELANSSQIKSGSLPIFVNKG